MAKNRVSYFPAIVNIANRNCCVFLAFLHKNLKNLIKKTTFSVNCNHRSTKNAIPFDFEKHSKNTHPLQPKTEGGVYFTVKR
jgi:hypothetical protein